MWRRRSYALALAAVLMAAVSGLLGGPASAAPSGPVTAAPSGPVAAAGPLAFTRTHCESFGKRILCLIAVTGGTTPYTIRWVLNGSPTPQFNDRLSMSLLCAVGSPFHTDVTVTDAAGASISYSNTTICISAFP
ncbi:MAG TPA: hypothetical protein VMU51_30315 [Mycobacteriales bacterium]|nr:hypothetical protein [Mycobacteriales bacterium]